MSDVLNVKMQPNDAGAKTIRDYLRALVRGVWEENEGFSGKRPFGNSGWQGDLELALVKAGKVKGKLDPDGYVMESDWDEVNRLIHDAIDRL